MRFYEGKKMNDSSSNPIRDALNHAAGALQSQLDQISQMSGMFPDEDNAIQNSVESAEESLEEIANVLAQMDLDVDILIDVNGGCVQGVSMLDQKLMNINIYVSDSDLDGHDLNDPDLSKLVDADGTEYHTQLNQIEPDIQQPEGLAWSSFQKEKLC